ncbi:MULTISPECIES: DUF3363 domain-containing protein [Azotobacter]|uniref:DUF3363 domain-containing protein n=2 Tax=Azotobacter group TaxID=351 RepID=UPI0000527C34|nr:DUF3363 domain-containing protein [Azotobacter vinelandii]
MACTKNQMRSGSVAGIYQRSVMLACGRHVMLDDSIGFSLVPWKPVVEERLGRVLTANVNGSSAPWVIGRHQSRAMDWIILTVRTGSVVARHAC